MNRNQLVSVAGTLLILVGGCDTNSDGSTDAGTVCVPDCDKKECGPDRCGGKCGECNDCTGNPDPGSCVEGRCSIECDYPVCDGKECGDDTYGGSCGDCINDCTGEPDSALCSEVDGTCAHACCPYCDGRACGDDGCGGACGTCLYGQTCNPDGACVECTADCEGKWCGDPDGCGRKCRGPCPDAGDECLNGPDYLCMPLSCQPKCENRQCGDDDGCGGKCVVMCMNKCPCNAATFTCEGSLCCGQNCGDDDGWGGKCPGPCPDASKTCNTQTFVCE